MPDRPDLASKSLPDLVREYDHNRSRMVNLDFRIQEFIRPELEKLTDARDLAGLKALEKLLPESSLTAVRVRETISRVELHRSTAFLDKPNH